MSAYPGILTESNVDGSSNLKVYCREKSAGVFIIQPIGSINTFTYLILQNEVEQIFESKLEIIEFDMKDVNYINSKGLSVILKVHQTMKSRGGRVVLTNLQPHIKKVFEIINALPKQRIFANRHELDNYLDTMQNSYSDDSYITKSEAGTDNYIIWPGNNFNQGIEESSRM